MILKQKVLIISYVILFTFSLLMGIIFGFTDSHTPPTPFIIEFFVLLIGNILLVVDIVNKWNCNDNFFKKHYAHLIGLTLNGLIVLYMLMV